MNFCRHSVTLPPGLAASHGVLSAAALALTTDAQEAAARLLADGRARAAALVEEELARCRRDIAAAQHKALEQSAAMLAGMERLPRDFLAQAEATVIGLAQALFQRLVGTLAPGEQAAALLRQLVEAAPLRLPEPVLRLHPDDAAGLAPRLVPPGWAVQPDPAQAPRCWRLESSHGEWQFDFDAAVLALAQALDDK